MKPISAMIRSCLLIGALISMVAVSAFADSPVARSLVATAQVDSSGVFIDQILAPIGDEALPHLRVAAAPTFGQQLLLSRAQIQDLFQKNAPDLVGTNWTGPGQVRVVRRTR